MNTSTLDQLKDPTTILLAAGHGASDPGAEFGQFKERDQTIVIVDRMAAELRARGVTVEIAPHGEDTHDSIDFVNERFGFGDAWALEIHRDSASGLGIEDASLRCGIYYGTSEGSKRVGEFVRAAYLRQGAHPNSWARPDTASRHGSLGWIRQTRPTAHILELGFMEGRNTDEHLTRLAKIASAAVFEAFTGGASAASLAPVPVPIPSPTPLVTPVPATGTNRLRSKLLAGNTALEAVADEHLELTNSSQQREEVGLVQDALNLLASFGGNYQVDLGASGQFRGFYGPKTRTAVAAFETDFRLTTNGIVDGETILALDAAVAKAESGANPLPIVIPPTPGSGGYAPPTESAALLSGVDFSIASADKGKKYRNAYAAADADPRLAKGDPSNCRALLQFPKALFFEAKMAVCADGSPRANGDRPGSIDRPHGQLHTAKKNPVDGSDFNAETVPYIVLPGTATHGNFVTDFGIKDRDLAVVICKGQITPAFFGEVGPAFRLGEASIQVHENLVPAVRFPWQTAAKLSIRNASVEGKVLYLVFPGTAVAKGTMSADDWLAATLEAASKRFDEFIASGGAA